MDAEAGGDDMETESVKNPRTSEDSEKTPEDMKMAMALDEDSQEEKAREEVAAADLAAAFEAGGSTTSRTATVASASENTIESTTGTGSNDGNVAAE
jgi:hypothetical protein